MRAWSVEDRDLCVMRVVNSTQHAIDPSFTDTEHDRPDAVTLLILIIRGKAIVKVKDRTTSIMFTVTVQQQTKL
jgi:hypothetical protein